MTRNRDADGDLRGDLRWPTIPALWADAVQRFGAGEALVDGDVRLTWTELDAQVKQAARALLALGIEPQDRVAIWAPNCWEWVVALLAVHHAGAIVVPIRTGGQGDEVNLILGRTRSRMLFAVSSSGGADPLERMVAAGKQTDLPELEHIVMLRAEPGGQAPEHTISWCQFLSCANGAAPADVVARAGPLTSKSLSDVLFTSGTTGAPSGVLGTHGQSVRAFTTWADLTGLRPDDRYLIGIPFSHSWGHKAGILACLITGAVMVPLAVNDAGFVTERVSGERISLISGPPSLYRRMLERADGGPFAPSTLRLAVMATVPAPGQLVERMGADLGFQTVITGYGLTEATGLVTVGRHGDDPAAIAHTAGGAIPGVDLRVVDRTGGDLPTGRSGEVLVRGYNVMRGYFEDPGRTARAIDTDGWLHTGDFATMDERGYLSEIAAGARFLLEGPS